MALARSLVVSVLPVPAGPATTIHIGQSSPLSLFRARARSLTWCTTEFQMQRTG